MASAQARRTVLVAYLLRGWFKRHFVLRHQTTWLEARAVKTDVWGDFQAAVGFVVSEQSCTRRHYLVTDATIVSMAGRVSFFNMNAAVM